MKIKLFSPHNRVGIGDYTDALYSELLKLNPNTTIIPNNNPLTPNPLYFINAALQSSCDILHIQFNVDLFGKFQQVNGPYIYLYYILAKLMGPVIITTIHDIPDIANYSLLNRWYIRLLHLPVFILSKRLIVHTEEAKNQLAEYGVNPNKIKIIPIGINTNVALPNMLSSKKQLGLSFKKVLFIWGFVRPSKKYEEVIRALPYLDKNIILLIAGPVRPWCQKYLFSLKTITRALDLTDRVLFDNKIILEDAVPTYFGASDIAIFPYSDITQSAALSQALAYRRLILTSDIPAFRSIKITWNCIETYKQGNQEDMIAKINILLTNKQLQTKLIRNINEILQKTNWTQIAKQTYEVYHMN